MQTSNAQCDPGQCMLNFHKAVLDFKKYICIRFMGSNGRTFDKEIQYVRKSADALAECLRKMDKQSRLMFINNHRGELIQSWNILAGPFTKPYLGIDRVQKTRGGIDAVVNALRMKSPEGVFAYLPTRIFTAFCDGVFFSESNLNTTTAGPAYHRASSCGSRLENLNVRLGPASTNTNNMVTSKKQRTKTCLIERLLYKSIYNAVLDKQDGAHEKELYRTQTLFDHYNPNEDIRIIVHYERVIYPVQLIIITTNKNSGRVTTQTFTRVLEDAAEIRYGTVLV